jgi:hypothetical protein
MRRQHAQQEIRNQERKHNERDHSTTREEVAAQLERQKERGNKRNERDMIREAADDERDDG